MNSRAMQRPEHARRVKGQEWAEGPTTPALNETMQAKISRAQKALKYYFYDIIIDRN
jgi:hypothetical protein